MSEPHTRPASPGVLCLDAGLDPLLRQAAVTPLELRPAADAAEALRHCRSRGAALLVLGAPPWLPQLMSPLRADARTRYIPVMLLASWAEVAKEVREIMSKVDEVLSPDVDPGLLSARVKRWLSYSRQPRPLVVSDWLIHDLNNPLNNLVGSTDLLLMQLHSDSAPSERNLRRLRSMRASCEDLSLLLESLGELDLLVRGERTVNLTVENAVALAVEAHDLLCAIHARHEPLLDIGGASDAPVLADRALLPRVLVHLCVQALRRTGGAAPLSLDIERTAEHVRLILSDHGLDLAEDQLRAFAAADPDPRVPLGIRLAFARAAILAQGGTIEAHLRDGGGTRFVIELSAP